MAVDMDRPVVRRQEAHDRLAKLGLAVALDPCDTDDLTAADLERDTVDDGTSGRVLDPEAFHLEDDIAGAGRLLVHRQLDGASHHQRGQLLVGGGRRRRADDSRRDGGP